MDTNQLTKKNFWDSVQPLVLVNDRDPIMLRQKDTLSTWAIDQPTLRGHLFFSTSGSTGAGKWVALSRSALLASATAVNHCLGVTQEDVWLCALPVFHVGGMGIMARAYLANCEVCVYDADWNPERFTGSLSQCQATLTSLVPTQVVDLVSAGIRAPQSLRAVLVGGGALADSVYQQARELGWPVMETYGMTEAASQIATATLGERRMQILSCWETRVNGEGVLEFKGVPMMTGYVKVEQGDCKLEKLTSEGWFATRDRVVIENGVLEFHGRSDRVVKVLGELVDLAAVELELVKVTQESRESALDMYTVALPDLRSGHRLVVCCMRKDETSVSMIKDQYNLVCSPVKRIHDVVGVSRLPVSDLGKIRYAELTKMVAEQTSSK